MAAASPGVNAPPVMASTTLARASGRSAALAIFGKSNGAGRSLAGGIMRSITSLHAHCSPALAASTTFLTIVGRHELFREHGGAMARAGFHAVRKFVAGRETSTLRSTIV